MGYDDNEYESDEEEDPYDLCPYCGNEICPTDAECDSCIEHVEECRKEADGHPPFDEPACFVIIALY